MVVVVVVVVETMMMMMMLMVMMMMIVMVMMIVGVRLQCRALRRCKQRNVMSMDNVVTASALVLYI